MRFRMNNHPCVLLGFYKERHDATDARRQLRAKRIWRSANVHKARDGRIEVENITSWFGIFWGAGLGLLGGILSGLAALGYEGLFVGVFGPVIFALATVIGAISGVIVFHILGLGIGNQLVKKLSSRLVPGETVVIVQASPLLVGRAIKALRQGVDTDPALFVFHARHVRFVRASRKNTEVTITKSSTNKAGRFRIADDLTATKVGGGMPLLRILDQSESVTNEVQRELADASRLEQRISQSAEWILDNAHIVQAQIDDVRLNLSKKFYRSLPKLDADPQIPRVYRFALDLVERRDGYLDIHSIGEFLESCQERTPFTIGELWAFPLMLKIALIDRLRWLAEELHHDLHDQQIADFWANRLLVSARLEPTLVFSFLADLAQIRPEPSRHFAARLIGQLHDEAVALVPVVSLLEQKLANKVDEIVLTDKAAQAAANVSIGNCVTSLRMLILLDWREVSEEHSRVERRLAQDPANGYSSMDFETRNRYRGAVEELSRAGGRDEDDVANASVELARKAAEDGAALPLNHVGYYLVGRGRPLLIKSLEVSEPLKRRVLGWVYQHHTPLYLGAIGGLTLSLLCLIVVLGSGFGTGPPMLLIAAILSTPVISQLAVQMVNYLCTRLLPPRLLPKMSFAKGGIPDQFRTLVVVPMLLANEPSLRWEIEKLEIRYLANQDPNLIFALFSDYVDADTAQAVGDELLQVAIDGIETLNQRHGKHCFYLFHRERVWTECEQSYIGWERKRGKLEELNRLISGETQPSEQPIVRVGEAERLTDVRFVITLDSDTQLLRDTGRRLVETLAHPLNCPSLAQEENPDAYAIIQPRVTTTPLFGVNTPFRRLFTDPVGIDPYTRAVSDVYQDLAGEGSYVGKGIYDPRVFHRALNGRLPEQLILSHDLIEGAHVRVGLASDIELLDDFPADYIAYSGRQHRWIRGDWQIARWCLPKVPGPDGKLIVNPLNIFNRWKIFDNLRRSLAPAGMIAFLVASWFNTSAMSVIASAAVGLLFAFPLLSRLLTCLTTRPWPGAISWPELGHDAARMVVEISLTPYQAIRSLDAVIKVLHRLMVSGRHFLQWASAVVPSSKAAVRARAFLALLSLIALAAVGLATLVFLFSPGNFFAAAPFLVLWILSPLSGWWLNQIPKPLAPGAELPIKDVTKLREVARQTWRFFDEFTGTETSWLPPDNFQVSPKTALALRTSPTNIGLGLLGVAAAYDFGFLTIDLVVERTRNTLATVTALERYNGHLLNWYDISTLEPLEPRYVSTVDSGNFLASLWALEMGLAEILGEPLIGPQSLSGLDDTLRLLRKALSPAEDNQPHTNLIETLSRIFSDPPKRMDEIIRRLRSARAPAQQLAAQLRRDENTQAEATYWAGQIESQVASWIALVERYLSWVELLDHDLVGIADLGGPDTHAALLLSLAQAPSLRELAAGKYASLTAFMERYPTNNDNPQLRGNRIAILKGEVAKAQWLAGETLAQAKEAMHEMRELGKGMGMGFLYDAQRRLFNIGYNVSEQRLDSSYYDLLASEARLASFVAIARGDVPNNHWLAMSRPFGSVRGHRVLLSWSGTMFEYLLPLLLQRSFPYSLLDNACRQALTVQKAYAEGLGVPWGISEAAFSDLDAEGTYQYQAFGVPGLGLKRGLADSLVVSPYSTLLALAIDSKSALLNLRALERVGLHGAYGFMEAIDYSRPERRSGEPGVIVHAYMAHHQAMGLLALDNLLNGQPMQRRFHADPRVKATQPLLYERLPLAPPVYKATQREGGYARATVGQSAPPISTFATPHSPAPKVQLLSNGRYSLMVTNAGGGYSRWDDFDLTRWRADVTCDDWGVYCYLRDLKTNQVWSNIYQPVGGPLDKYFVGFASDRAEIRRLDAGIETETEIIVASEDDVEIRRITLINRSNHRCVLEVTSYIELALAQHAVDRQHPAFNKLFIETEALSKQHALLATRRRRDVDEPAVWAMHMLVAKDTKEESLQFETDRGRFIGRGRTTGSPAALYQNLSNTSGQVLDPIFSLRRTLYLEPGGRGEFYLMLGAADTRDGACALAEKYNDAHAIQHQLDRAWDASQLGMRRLRIQPDEARRFQQLAGSMLYPGWQLRTTGERIKKNRLDQSGLWSQGISGDLPIALVTINESRDMGLVRQMLQAHAYWRLHGFKADLVILNQEVGSYEQALNYELRRLIQGYAPHTGIDVPGGIFLRQEDQMPEEGITLLLAVARVVLVGARGPLAAQLATMPHPAWEFPPPLKTQFVGQEPSAPLPFMELDYFNGLGGFTGDGREYVIYLGPDSCTPAPWVNVMANPAFGTLISESGSGFTWAGNSQQNRLTAWGNDPLCDAPSEAVYIRDEESGGFWSPTPLPIRELDAYRARHGAGYTVFEHNSHAIEQEMTVFVPQDDAGGDPLCLKRLRLRNDGSRYRRLAVTFYAEWTLGEHREDTQMHIFTEWDKRSQAIFAYNHYHLQAADRVSFATISPPAHSISADRQEFLGRNGSLADPAAMHRVCLSSRTGTRLDPCAVLQIKLELEPGESREVTFILGQAASAEQARELIARYREAVVVDGALERTRLWWDRTLQTVQVTTPELATNLLANRWLLYQTLSCRIWGRSGLYQSGGAFGFRDQLQDVLALLYSMPQLAREHILLACGRQFPEGDVQHWWHPDSGVGVRSRCSDDLLWLPFAVARYVQVTGDTQLLDEEVNFIQAPLLEDSEHEIFVSPKTSSQSASVYEHCRLAIKKGMTQGPHGLPLMGSGDWNDGMNRIGQDGRGESVWLAWFIVEVLNAFSECSELCGQADDAARFREAAGALAKAVEDQAWDGAWYLRAYCDDGTPVGSAASEEARIDSIPQSWAAICGGADSERTAQALQSAREQLVRTDEKLVLLFTPPFDSSAIDPGYIKGYPPGVRENGGQYTHAALWLALGLIRRGDADGAAALFRLLNPIEHAREPEDVARYKVEPYVVAADVYSLTGRVGQGGWTWYTGSAGWMYRLLIEEMLGLQIHGSELTIDPVLPSAWKTVSLRFYRGKAVYEVTIDNPERVHQGLVWLEMDGRRLGIGEVIQLEELAVKHKIRVRLGTGAANLQGESAIRFGV
ncbi:GH36-type glycosyl hydrolase domain-containing protein [Desulfoferula mesophila]